MTTTAVHGVGTAARQLLRAAADRTPCGPVRGLLTDVAAAYAVQDVLTAARIAAGARVVGRKIGLTSTAVQAQLGVDSPDAGVLFADMRRGEDAPIALHDLLQPRIEAEVAFVLAADLDGEVTPTTVRAAVDHVVASLEIVDSRIAGWDITLVDTVADNASCGAFVLGSAPVELGDLDVRTVAMRMVDGTGTQVSAGTGADCLGDPVEAVCWLARMAASLGRPLRAGEIVLSGALGPMVAVTPGSSFDAELSGLGRVSARFADVAR